MNSRMKTHTLTPGELTKGRKAFFIFLFLNTISFPLLTGNIITLFALRMGAGNILVGMLSSFAFISYIFLIPGKRLVEKMGAVKVYGVFYRLRVIMMIPVLASPLLFVRGMQSAALATVVVCSLAFNIVRGIQITSDNPILTELAGEKDRGLFMSRIQLISQLVGLITGIFMAMLLGENAPLSTYALFILTGLASGFAASQVIFRIPRAPERQNRFQRQHLAKPERQPDQEKSPAVFHHALSRHARILNAHTLRHRLFKAYTSVCRQFGDVLHCDRQPRGPGHDGHCGTQY